MIRIRTWAALAALAITLALAHDAEAKKFRYAAGPRAPEDTVLSVAEVEVVPIVRKRGPRVPATNLQITSMVANTAFDRALTPSPLDSTRGVVVVPTTSHPLNFVIEHSILRHLSRRGITATVRRVPLDDDSTYVGSGRPLLLEYDLATARVTYLRLIGWLPGRVRVERQSQVEGRLALRDPESGSVLWVGDASYNLLDSFPKGQLPLIEDPRYNELKSASPSRNVDKLVEPVIVVAIVSGLIALFFQNRP